MDIQAILPAVGVLTALTGIITQVLKKVTWGKLPTNVLALAVAQVLTLCAGAAYAQHSGITITWYMGVGGVVAGFLVAYAAMFGFDKLQEVLKGVNGHAGK